MIIDSRTVSRKKISVDRSRRGPQDAPLLRILGWRCPRLRLRKILAEEPALTSTDLERNCDKLLVCNGDPK